MTNQRAAIVLGGSGSVGAALLRELLQDDAFDAVISVSRRSLPEAVALARSTGHRLLEKLVPDMKPGPLAAATLEAAREFDGDLEGFSVLGVGGGTAKLTLEEHRAVDVHLNEAFARALRDSGKVQHLAFMSAAGADPTAKASGSGAAGMPRYARVKGESEEAVRAGGPPVVSVFRPGMIIGSQHTPWLLEKTLPLFSFVTPEKYKSISVEQIAQAMIATAKHHPASSGTYHYPEMMALIKHCYRGRGRMNLGVEGRAINGEGVDFEGSYRVLEAVLVGDSVLVVYDWMAFTRGKPARNLFCYDRRGRLLWRAPDIGLGATDAYTRVLSEVPLWVANFAGYTCHLDLTSGRVLETVFTK